MGRDQAIHHHGVAVLLAVGLEEIARLGGLAEPHQAFGDGHGRAQAVLVERHGAAVLGFSRSLVAGHLVDLRVDHQRRRFGALAGRGLQLGDARARGGVVLLAGLQPRKHILAQRAELTVPANAPELLLGGAIVALLDGLDHLHEVGQAVARPRHQDLRRELSGLVDAPGIHAQPEGSVDQLGVIRRLGERQVDLLGSGIIVVILLGDAGGEITTAERDRRQLQAARRLRLALGRRLGLASTRRPLLRIAGCGDRKKQRCR